MGANVRGEVRVMQNNLHRVSIVGANAGTVIMPPGGTTTGGTGSYLESLVIIPAVATTVGSCQVLLADFETTGTVIVFPTNIAGTTTQLFPPMTQVFIGGFSKFGPWRLTTGGNVIVTAIGNFQK